MNYTDLLNEASAKGLVVKEKMLQAHDGRIKENKIAIRKDMPEIEKACVLAEELGHFYTAAGDIFEQDSIQNIKTERAGRIFAYNRMIGLTGIINAYKRNCRSLPEMAEYLEVTEEFLQEALKCYRQKYGISCQIDNYIIFFEPSLAVMELIAK